MTSDAATSGNFYTELFGWGRNDQDMGEFGIYTQFQINGKVVASQYKMVAEQEAMNVPPNWGQYVTVNDADATTAKVTEMGEMGQCTLFNRSGGRGAGGMMAIQPEMGPIPPHRLVYFAVEDVDACFPKAASLGGPALGRSGGFYSRRKGLG